MTPLRLAFTGLDLDPVEVLDRVHHGIIPLEWYRYRFAAEFASTSQINRWLLHNIAGRWAIMIDYVGGKRQVTIAFERAYDGSAFVLSDGPRQCCVPECN